MSDNLIKLLPLNDAPASVRQDLILNAFVGEKSNILGFVTGRRVVESVQALANERDAAVAAREKSSKGMAAFHARFFEGIDAAQVEASLAESTTKLAIKPTDLADRDKFVAHVNASEDSAKNVADTLKAIAKNA